MLMNLYLTPLDMACRHARYLRYADDIIMVRSGVERFLDLTKETNKLSIKVVEEEKGPYEGGNHLGAVVHSTCKGQLVTSVNYKKLIKL